MIESMNIETNFVCPEFSYTLMNIDIPTWKIKSLKINDELSSLAKAVTPHEAFQQLYRELVSGVYSDHVAIFTDESKTDQGVGAAAVAPNQTKTASLPEMVWR